MTNFRECSFAVIYLIDCMIVVLENGRHMVWATRLSYGVKSGVLGTQATGAWRASQERALVIHQSFLWSHVLKMDAGLWAFRSSMKLFCPASDRCGEPMAIWHMLGRGLGPHSILCCLVFDLYQQDLDDHITPQLKPHRSVTRSLTKISDDTIRNCSTSTRVQFLRFARLVGYRAGASSD